MRQLLGYNEKAFGKYVGLWMSKSKEGYEENLYKSELSHHERHNRAEGYMLANMLADMRQELCPSLLCLHLG